VLKGGVGYSAGVGNQVCLGPVCPCGIYLTKTGHARQTKGVKETSIRYNSEYNVSKRLPPVLLCLGTLMNAPPRPGDSIAFVDAKLARPFDPCRFIQNVFGVTARLGQSGSRVGGKYTRPSLVRMKRNRMTRGGPNTNQGPHPWVCVLANPLLHCFSRSAACLGSADL
jgi:hypothetical protein